MEFYWSTCVQTQVITFVLLIEGKIYEFCVSCFNVMILKGTDCGWDFNPRTARRHARITH
jgi:hypothetical protein